MNKKENTLSLEEKDAYRKRLFGVVKHVNNVREAGELLAERIIYTAENKSDLDFARRLIQKIRSHDASKFEGIEWEYLHRIEHIDEQYKADAERMLGVATHQHQQTNPHHPEYFVGGISQMNDLQIAEMVCDWKARSQEMGTDLRAYIKDIATERFGFSTRTAVYRKIKKFVDLLLDNTF